MLKNVNRCSSSSTSTSSSLSPRSEFRLTKDELFRFVAKKNCTPQYKSKFISDQRLYLSNGLAPWELFKRERVPPSQDYLYIFTHLKKTCSSKTTTKGGKWKPASLPKVIQHPKTKQDAGFFEKSFSFYVSGIETGWTIKVYYIDSNGWAVCRIDRGSKFPFRTTSTTTAAVASTTPWAPPLKPKISLPQPITSAAAAAAASRPPLQKLKRPREETHDRPIKKHAKKPSLDVEESISYDIPWDFEYFQKLEEDKLLFDEKFVKETLIRGDFWKDVPLAEWAGNQTLKTLDSCMPCCKSY